MALLVRGVTAEKFETWLTPKQAVQALEAVFGTDSRSHISKNTILERCRKGLMRAVAGASTRSDVKDKNFLHDIDQNDWHYVREDSIFWTSGDFTFTTQKDYSRVEIGRFAVRFDPDGIVAIIDAAGGAPAVSATSAQPPETITPKNLGGAPRKEWWDDFWIALCGQIYEGNLLPKTQADLQKAMLDWASEHGHDMSETTAKVAARKLFKAWDLGGKN